MSWNPKTDEKKIYIEQELNHKKKKKKKQLLVSSRQILCYWVYVG